MTFCLFVQRFDQQKATSRLELIKETLCMRVFMSGKCVIVVWKPFRNFLRCILIDIIYLWNLRSENCYFCSGMEISEYFISHKSTFLANKLVISAQKISRDRACYTFWQLTDSAGMYRQRWSICVTERYTLDEGFALIGNMWDHTSLLF